MSDLLAAALGYADRNWRVLPLHTADGGRCSCGDAECENPAKHPRIRAWQDAASADKAKIREWWGRWPNSNVGVRMGGGLVAVDVDPGHDGEDSLHDLEREHGALSQTLESLTGGGGRHLIFRCQEHVRPTVAKLGAGVDVRGDGSYIVAPPSIHASGRRYEWSVDGHPEALTLADLPDWIVALNGRRNGTVPEGPIPDGQRNIDLTRVAGAMRRQGAGFEAIRAGLEADNRARCQPPLADTEVEQIARSVCRYPPAEVRLLTKGSEREQTQTEGPPRLPFGSLAEALANVPAEPDWLLHGYLMRSGIALQSGQPKVGKSTWLSGLVAAVSEGAPFLDRATEPTRVLYLSEETEQVFKEKQQLFDLDHNGMVDVLWHYQALAAGLRWPDVVGQAVGWCEEREIGLLIVDTFPAWAGLAGDSENQSGAINEAMEPLKVAAAAGLSVFLTSHQRKSKGSHGEGVRGSNAFVGAVDVLIEMERAGDDEPDVRVLKSESRLSATPRTLAVRLEGNVYTALGDLETHKAENRRAEVAEVVTDEWQTIGEIGDQLEGHKQGTIRKDLHALHQADQLERRGEGGKGQPWEYRLVGSTDADAEYERVQQKFGEGDALD